MSHPNDRLFSRHSSLQNLTEQASGEAPQAKPVVNEADLKPVLGRSNGQLGLIAETVKMQRDAPLDEQGMGLKTLDRKGTLRVAYCDIAGGSRVYQVMFGNEPTGIGPSKRSTFNDLGALKDELQRAGLKLGKKSSKGYEIVHTPGAYRKGGDPVRFAESLDEKMIDGADARIIAAMRKRDAGFSVARLDGFVFKHGYDIDKLMSDLAPLKLQPSEKKRLRQIVTTVWNKAKAKGDSHAAGYVLGDLVHLAMTGSLKDAPSAAATTKLLKKLGVTLRQFEKYEVPEYTSPYAGESIDEADPVRSPFSGKVIDPETVRASKLAAWVRDNLERKPHPSSKKQMVVRYKGKGVALLSPEGSKWRVETIEKDSSGRSVGERLGTAANLDNAMKFVAMHLKPNLSEGKVDRAEHKRRVEKAMRAQGTRVVREIDPQEYPKISGMEGPFRFRDGRVLYYDPREGKYYDSKSDMYVSNDDLPESFDEGVYSDKAMSMKKVEGLIEKKGWMVLRSELSGSEYYIQFSLSGSRAADTMAPKDRHKAIETFVKKNRIPASEYGSEGSGYGFMVFFPGEFKESVTVESLRSAAGLDEAKSGKFIGIPRIGTRVRYRDDDEDEPGGKIVRIVRENPDWPERTVVRVEWDPEPGEMYGEKTDVATGFLVHEAIDEASAEQEAYQKLFKEMLAGRKLADMTADQKRELFNKIEKRWADHPANESEELEEASVAKALPKLVKQVFMAIATGKVSAKGAASLAAALRKHARSQSGPLATLAAQLGELLQDYPDVGPKDTRVTALRRYFERTLGFDDSFAFESVEESQQVAKTILQQLGGQKRLAMMTGAKNFMYDDSTRTLSFKIGRNAKGVNHVSVTLRNDLYDLKFGAVRMGAMKVKAEETGVSAEMLSKMFEKHTGMYLKFAPDDSKMFGEDAVDEEMGPFIRKMKGAAVTMKTGVPEAPMIGHQRGAYFYQSASGAKNSTAIPPGKRKDKDYARTKFREMLANEVGLGMAKADELIRKLDAKVSSRARRMRASFD